MVQFSDPFEPTGTAPNTQHPNSRATHTAHTAKGNPASLLLPEPGNGHWALGGGAWRCVLLLLPVLSVCCGVLVLLLLWFCAAVVPAAAALPAVRLLCSRTEKRRRRSTGNLLLCSLSQQQNRNGLTHKARIFPSNYCRTICPHMGECAGSIPVTWLALRVREMQINNRERGFFCSVAQVTDLQSCISTVLDAYNKGYDIGNSSLVSSCRAAAGSACGAVYVQFCLCLPGETAGERRITPKCQRVPG